MNNSQPHKNQPKGSLIGCLFVLSIGFLLLGLLGFPLHFQVRRATIAIGVVLLLVTLVSFWYVEVTNKHPLQWLRAKFGLGKNVGELSRRLGVTKEELQGFEPSYQTTTIPKRSGGERILLIPDAKTKAMQRRLLHRVLQSLRAHPCAKGFEKGESIVSHAKDHVAQEVLVHVDIVDFFPTTTADRIENYFRRIGWNKEAASILTKLTTWQDGLPQGAPTSPRLSNLVNYILDAQLAHLAHRRDAIYSRYADDITFSFAEDRPKTIRGTIQKIRRLLKSKGYEMHRRKKLHIRRPHQRQEVTGLVVNEKVQLPRKTRRWLRAVLHHQKTGKPTTLTEQQIQGWLAFVTMVDQQKEL